MQFYLKKPIILLNLQPPLGNKALYTIKNILVVFEDMAIKKCDMKKILTIIALFVAFTATAQRVRFEIKFTADASDVQKVYVQPCGDSNTITLRLKGNSYVGNVPFSESGFYNIIALKGHSQVILPVYVGDVKEATLEVEAQAKDFALKNTPENRALSALSRSTNDLDRALWLNDDFSDEELKLLVNSYKILLDSIVAAEGITGEVAEFMKVYAYSHAYNAYSNIPRTQKMAATTIPFRRSELLPPANMVFDNDYTPVFFTAIHIVIDDLTTSPVLLDKLYSLYENYKNENVRKAVAAVIVGDFISHYKYSQDFEGGLEIIKKATEQYSLSNEFINEYMKRKATIPGSPFPGGVKLVDINGKPFDFSKLKGKYVYIDMWASWCAPCCKEVPYLQKLEKELKNKDVVFVSVSCDSDENAWRKKMADLNMHGIQLLDNGNSLGDALNVKGIPFFLIYDKQGNLHTYNAKRPSSGEVIKEILEGLQ